MSTALLPPKNDKRTVAFFMRGTKEYTVEKTESGTNIVKGLKVFRSGTFKDSRGEQATWTPEHLQQMVFNFEMLRDRGLFADVPARADHTKSVNSLVGYFAGLSTDGAFIYADIEFTEPEAFAKFDRGTYRARSLEVGFYETNDESLFWPVVLGVAFVDIGAVEGLNHSNFRVFDETKETDPVTPEQEQWLAAANYAQALADLQAVPAAEVDALKASFNKDDKAPHAFSIAGVKEADFAKVQSHIDVLEKFRADTTTANRNAFIDGLVNGHKLAAPQAESMKELVAEMSPEQYEKFRGSYEGAPVIRLFENHADVTNPTGEKDKGDAEKATLEETVAEFRKSGMSDEQIKQTPSFQRLEALKAAG